MPIDCLVLYADSLISGVTTRWYVCCNLYQSDNDLETQLLSLIINAVMNNYIIHSVQPTTSLSTIVFGPLWKIFPGSSRKVYHQNILPDNTGKNQTWDWQVKSPKHFPTLAWPLYHINNLVKIFSWLILPLFISALPVTLCCSIKSGITERSQLYGQSVLWAINFVLFKYKCYNREW